MRTTTHKILGPTAVLAAVVIFATMPGVALAQTDDRPPTDGIVTDRTAGDRPSCDHDLGTLKERILEQIDRRLEALDRMSEAVDENEHVTKDHAKDLQDDYKDTKKILEDAAKDVEKAETLAELQEIAPEVFADTLVFALLAPKTHLVAASDRMVDAERFTVLGEHIQTIIDRLADNGHDMSAAQAALDEMLRLVQVAADTAGPVADSVIGLDPSDWPDPAKAALAQGKADLESARGSLGEARDNAHEVIRMIREILGSDS